MHFYFCFKSLCDRFFALLALFVFSSVLLVLACLIRARLGAPVFFTQIRPGYKAKPFKLIKFRSMTDVSGLDGKLLSDQERITPFGAWLRKSSLDELPELWNILCGDMSFVGPRPLLMSYLPLYNADQYKRHAVLPGITGLAQVNGRNSLSWEEKFCFDLAYVNRQSFWLDLKILIITVSKVLSGEGVSAVGEVTMTPFTGTPPCK